MQEPFQQIYVDWVTGAILGRLALVFPKVLTLQFMLKQNKSDGKLLQPFLQNCAHLLKKIVDFQEEYKNQLMDVGHLEKTFTDASFGLDRLCGTVFTEFQALGTKLGSPQIYGPILESMSSPLKSFGAKGVLELFDVQGVRDEFDLPSQKPKTADPYQEILKHIISQREFIVDKMDERYKSQSNKLAKTEVDKKRCLEELQQNSSKKDTQTGTNAVTQPMPQQQTTATQPQEQQPSSTQSRHSQPSQGNADPFTFNMNDAERYRSTTMKASARTKSNSTAKSFNFVSMSKKDADQVSIDKALSTSISKPLTDDDRQALRDIANSLTKKQRTAVDAFSNAQFEQLKFLKKNELGPYIALSNADRNRYITSSIADRYTMLHPNKKNASPSSSGIAQASSSDPFSKPSKQEVESALRRSYGVRDGDDQSDSESSDDLDSDGDVVYADDKVDLLV